MSISDCILRPRRSLTDHVTVREPSGPGISPASSLPSQLPSHSASPVPPAASAAPPTAPVPAPAPAAMPALAHQPAPAAVAPPPAVLQPAMAAPPVPAAAAAPVAAPAAQQAVSFPPGTTATQMFEAILLAAEHDPHQEQVSPWEFLSACLHGSCCQDTLDAFGQRYLGWPLVVPARALEEPSSRQALAKEFGFVPGLWSLQVRGHLCFSLVGLATASPMHRPIICTISDGPEAMYEVPGLQFLCSPHAG